MKYKVIEFKDSVELVSCNGLVTQKGGEFDVHGHLVVSNHEGKAYGGHALDGCKVDLTCELILCEFGKAINRKLVPGTGRYILDV